MGDIPSVNIEGYGLPTKMRWIHRSPHWRLANCKLDKGSEFLSIIQSMYSTVYNDATCIAVQLAIIIRARGLRANRAVVSYVKISLN